MIIIKIVAGDELLRASLWGGKPVIQTITCAFVKLNCLKIVAKAPQNLSNESAKREEGFATRGSIFTFEFVYLSFFVSTGFSSPPSKAIIESSWTSNAKRSLTCPLKRAVKNEETMMKGTMYSKAG